ncbi:hypothetical protein [Pseudoxanthomonas sp. PXM02]|jgi:hypothetical protein|uniref:hypothetical protein n=1 Tax=Pseudoxanthomonas sp. PXM02 TaxID=2769294 RepID=UPI001781E518|nr:hypothetical protein [Pseudoxanthomonas sp. PXM02]MBD9480251.1 hypothetical protein [Pseudoxanthomonas sp. PXM02]
MTDIVLKDVDPILAERIRRVSHARGWPIHDTIFNLLEQGLFVCEAEVRGGFDDREVNALAEAISALKDVPPGKGF